MEKKKITGVDVNIGFTCPHCGTYAQFDLESRSEFEIEYMAWIYSLWICQRCKKLVFRCYTHVSGVPGSKLIAQYPSKVTVSMEFKGRVPEHILMDYQSAVKCYEFEEFRASVAMCRRSLQASLLDHDADRKKKLQFQIDELHTKDPNKFPAHVKDWAHGIRIFGNWGAHPDEDGLEDVDQETALETIEFLRQYFNYVYVMPQKIIETQQRVAEIKEKKQQHRQKDES